MKTAIEVLEEAATALDNRAKISESTADEPQMASEDQSYELGQAYAFRLSADLLRTQAKVLREAGEIHR